MMDNNNSNYILDANKEFVNELDIQNVEGLRIYSRDWTIQTIANQVEQGNIDLNPKFQRRNAWNDEKRSLLIESLILKLPVPEIVLAESHKEKNKFIVLDGKQRLLTIMGFMYPEKYKYWENPKLKKLKILSDENGKTWNDFLSNDELFDIKRRFENSDIRCTVVFNQKSNDILYEIFYRLNSGAVPLSMQELRNSLVQGNFSDFLIEKTNILSPIHKVLNLNLPDKRLLDAEIILKFLANKLFIQEYTGNLKTFLDNTLVVVNKEWIYKYENQINTLYIKFNKGIELLEQVFGTGNVGKYFGEKQFNRNLFDVEVFYFSELSDNKINDEKNQLFKEKLKELFKEDSEFRKTLQASTTTKKNVKRRYEIFGNLVKEVFDFDCIPKFQ